MIVIVVLAILGVIGTALGKKDDKVKDATAGKGDAKSEETKEKTEFAIGETAEQKGIQSSLLSTTESSGNEFTTPDEGNVFLLCEFEITNNLKKGFHGDKFEHNFCCLLRYDRIGIISVCNLCCNLCICIYI